MLSSGTIQRIFEHQRALHGEVNLRACCGAWEDVVKEILDQLRGNPAWAANDDVVVAIIAAWRQIVGYTLMSHEQEHRFRGNDLDVLRLYYEDLLNLVDRVQEITSPSPEVDERIQDIRHFCKRYLQVMELFDVMSCAGTHFVYMTHWYASLLHIALGVRLSALFRELYDASMAVLSDMIQNRGIVRTDPRPN